MENKFQTIPGFSKYETNGVFIRNAHTKNTITHRNGGHHQLKNDDGKNLDMTVEKAMALIKGKQPAPKPEKKKPTLTGNGRIHKPANKKNVSEQIRDMYAKGLDAKTIKEKLGLTKGHYVNDIIWKVNNPGGKKS